MPIILSCFPPQCCNSKAASCPGQVLKFLLTCSHTQGHLLMHAGRSHLHFHKHEHSFYSQANILFLFLYLCHKEGTRNDLWYEELHIYLQYVLQSLPAVSHLISDPKYITVYLPVLPCNKTSAIKQTNKNKKCPTTSIVCNSIYSRCDRFVCDACCSSGMRIQHNDAPWWLNTGPSGPLGAALTRPEWRVRKQPRAVSWHGAKMQRGAFVYLFPPICCILCSATVSQLNEA